MVCRHYALHHLPSGLCNDCTRHLPYPWCNVCKNMLVSHNYVPGHLLQLCASPAQGLVAAATDVFCGHPQHVVGSQCSQFGNKMLRYLHTKQCRVQLQCKQPQHTCWRTHMHCRIRTHASQHLQRLQCAVWHLVSASSQVQGWKQCMPYCKDQYILYVRCSLVPVRMSHIGRRRLSITAKEQTLK